MKSICVLVLSICCGLLVSVDAKQPNVILIVADDLGYGGLHCYGNEWLETPNIDQLCADGMQFTNGYSSHPTCQPSRIALLSGQYAPRTGGYRVKDHHRGQEDVIRYEVPKLTGLGFDKVSLAEAFQAGGYKTAMYGKWHAGNYKKDAHPRYHGFEIAYECNSHYDTRRSDPEVELPEGMDFAEYFTGKAIDFMGSSVAEEQPFFLYMPYYLVHAPLETRSDYIEYFKSKLEGVEFVGKKAKDVPVIAAMTKHLDDCVGRLLQSLKSLGIAEETIVVFTSDNGSYNEAFVGGLRETKGSVYEGGLKVPYLFKWSGEIEAETISNERITHIDLYPTLLELSGVDRPNGYTLDGLSIAQYLKGNSDVLADRSIVCYYPKYAQFNTRTKKWKNSWRNVIFRGDYKLIEHVEYDEFELYNITDDPKEANELSRSYPEKLERMQVLLKEWKQELSVSELRVNIDYKL
ncbi:MAG TPA: hypothetical protein DCX06_12205 [Opitutae bacterium]|nr:hypothetical protein [Opitutae bacterium]